MGWERENKKEKNWHRNGSCLWVHADEKKSVAGQRNGYNVMQRNAVKKPNKFPCKNTRNEYRSMQSSVFRNKLIHSRWIASRKSKAPPIQQTHMQTFSNRNCNFTASTKIGFFQILQKSLLVFHTNELRLLRIMIMWSNCSSSFIWQYY